jgi:hypothetical protein
VNTAVMLKIPVSHLRIVVMGTSIDGQAGIDTPPPHC